MPTSTTVSDVLEIPFFTYYSNTPLGSKCLLHNGQHVLQFGTGLSSRCPCWTPCLRLCNNLGKRATPIVAASPKVELHARMATSPEPPVRHIGCNVPSRADRGRNPRSLLAGSCSPTWVCVGPTGNAHSVTMIDTAAATEIKAIHRSRRWTQADVVE